jgi:septal ring factor EnvC (AmiA/AmiB activator)
LNDEVERLNAELAEVTAARDDFFDECDRYVKRIKELEAKLLTEDKRESVALLRSADRILKALLVGKQSSQYKRFKAALDQMMP